MEALPVLREDNEEKFIHNPIYHEYRKQTFLVLNPPSFGDGLEAWQLLD